MPAEALGRYIAERRKHLRLTQKELAARLEQSGNYRAEASIANWEW